MKTKTVIYGIAVALTLATTLKAQNLYVGNHGTQTIGEYGMDGSTVNASLVTGLNDRPFGIANSPVPEPSTIALAGLGSLIVVAGGQWCYHREHRPSNLRTEK